MEIRSKSSINVLGVLFDSKLNWKAQAAQTIMKAKRTLHAIKLIKKYFTTDELKQLLTLNFYSVLYYNCEIWLTRCWNQDAKSNCWQPPQWLLKYVYHTMTVQYHLINYMNYKEGQLLQRWCGIDWQSNFTKSTMQEWWMMTGLILISNKILMTETTMFK